MSLHAETRPIDPSPHHGSHRQLLDVIPPDSALQLPIDAIVVPTIRPAKQLQEAMNLASDLGTGLIALCSGDANGADAVQRGDDEKVPVLAIDYAECRSILPDFATVDLLRREGFARRSDLSAKRNLALVLARAARLKRVLLLDDDIYGVKSPHVKVAAGAVDHYDAVGLDNDGYPDNSVVCHANRVLNSSNSDGGRSQEQFIGAGGMAIAAWRTRSFFPDIYNEDWFFLLGCGQPSLVAVTGEMYQEEYDPFAAPKRARDEELGDVLAEGLFWLLDHQLPIQRADRTHWEDILSRREYFINDLLREVGGSSCLDPDVKLRMAASLEAAQRTRSRITASLCQDFVQAWQGDLRTWRERVDSQTVWPNVDAALADLGWPGVMRSAVPWPRTQDDRLRSAHGWMDGASGVAAPSRRPAESPQLTYSPALS